jgi:hypothetical protein
MCAARTHVKWGCRDVRRLDYNRRQHVTRSGLSRRADEVSGKLPGERGRLPLSVLDWSLESIEARGDNDLFSPPFEFSIFRANWPALSNELLELRVDVYHWSEPRQLLLPKDAVSFRHACQLDPLDSLILTALVKLAGPRIEAKRQPRDRVFSARFAKAGSALYDTDVGWEQFWHQSRLRAEKSNAKFVARTDIADFYNQVPHAEIIRQLETCEIPARLVEAFTRFLKTFGGSAALTRGIPIGPHTGHLLAEIALMRVDALLATRGLEFSRYIDDYHICCNTQSEAQLALYDVAEMLHDELGLTLNRMKTTIDPVDTFIVEAKQRAREEIPSVKEQALLEAIRHVTSGNYDFTTFDQAFKKSPHAVSDEAIETLLRDEITRERVDYPKLGWLLRRLSQVGAPGGVGFVFENFEAFVPVIGDTARYLALAGANWNGDWTVLGEKILEHATNPIAQRSPYVQAVLFSLFAERKELNHLDTLVQRYAPARAPARRARLRAARAAGAADWLHSLRREADTLDSWSRRAFVYATTILPDRQREDCLRSIGAQATGADSILLGSLLAEREDDDNERRREPAGSGWAALLAQVSASRRSLAEERLDALGEALQQDVYRDVKDDELLLATWNLRNVGGGVFGYSERLPESLIYIARTLLSFDVVAIQEIRDKANIDRLLALLGPGWDKVICGEAPGVEGNSEMGAFLYRSSKAKFLGDVEQLVLGKKDLLLGKHQFARPPFLVNFEVGESKLTACTAHTYYGAIRGDKLTRRIAEITALAKLVSVRATKEKSTAFLLGDLNVVGPGDPTMAPLQRYELSLPDEFLRPTNVKGDKFYTQIAFKATKTGFRLRRAGAFPVFDHVFRAADAEIYGDDMKSSSAWETGQKKKGAKREPEDFYDTWRTFQISDHNPVWVALAI